MFLSFGTFILGYVHVLCAFSTYMFWGSFKICVLISLRNVLWYLITQPILFPLSFYNQAFLQHYMFALVWNWLSFIQHVLYVWVYPNLSKVLGTILLFNPYHIHGEGMSCKTISLYSKGLIYGYVQSQSVFKQVLEFVFGVLTNW